MAETSCRTPDPLPERVQPVAGSPAFSPLWVYWVARQYSRQQGRPVLGQGAIVSDALQAVISGGLVLYDVWPATTANYRAYSDDRPPQVALNAFKLRIAGEAKRLTSPDAVLDYLGAGYSVWVGVPWRGGNTTDRDGRFRWGSSSIGGHAVELLGYDLDLNVLYVGNSWDNAGWGFQPADPNAARGYGYCRWTDFARDLSTSALASGASEAVVITELDWSTPKPPDPPPAPKPPVPPVPTPVPPPAPPTPGPECKATVTIDGRMFAGTLRVVDFAPAPGDV